MIKKFYLAVGFGCNQHLTDFGTVNFNFVSNRHNLSKRKRDHWLSYFLVRDFLNYAHFKIGCKELVYYNVEGKIFNLD